MLSELGLAYSVWTGQLLLLPSQNTRMSWARLLLPYVSSTACPVPEEDCDVTLSSADCVLHSAHRQVNKNETFNTMFLLLLQACFCLLEHVLVFVTVSLEMTH